MSEIEEAAKLCRTSIEAAENMRGFLQTKKYEKYEISHDKLPLKSTVIEII